MNDVAYNKIPQWATGLLDRYSNGFFVIPASVILNTKYYEKLVTAFSFFSISRGIDCSIMFSVNMIVSWCGKTPNRNPTGISSKLSDAVNKLNNDGLVSLSGVPNGANIIKAKINLDKVTELCQQKKERFATIYVDEVSKIMEYSELNPKNRELTTDTLLCVFAYLRMRIYKRQSNMSTTQFGDYEERKTSNPETYNCYIQDMGDELGLSPRIITASIEILKDMRLIYYEPLPRIKGDKNVWRTGHTIFCNWYKREKLYVISGGKEYYEEEVKNRKKQLRFVSKDD